MIQRPIQIAAAALFTIGISLPVITPIQAHAGNGIQILDESSLEGLLPSFHLDHQGFALPADFPLAAPGSVMGAEVYPLYPMFKSKAFSKKFVGAVVPGKYFGDTSCEGQRRNSGATLVNLNFIPPQARAAAEMIASIKLDDGLKLVPYYFRCQLYGIRSDIQVTFTNTKTIGFDFSFGGPETINFGDQFVIGAAIRLGLPSTNVGSTSGLNLGNGINQIVEGIDGLVNGESAETLIARTVQFTPYIRAALARNHQELQSGATTESKRPDAIYNLQLELGPTSAPTLNRPVPKSALTSELNESLRELSANLPKEADWRKKLGLEVNWTLVVNDIEGNRLIQGVCDRLARIYELPEQVWPRCRIAATWAPNAYAFPGGDIFITAGLLGILKDLDSVALVLGHEIGHVAARHTSRKMPYVNAVSYTANGLSLVAGVAASSFSLQGGNGVLGEVTFLTWFPQSMAAAMGSGLVIDQAMRILMLGPIAGLMAHSREMEWQADRFGHEVALAAGADQASMSSGWNYFTDYTSKYLGVDRSLMARLMAGHPDDRERQAAIDRRYGKLIPSLQEYQAANRMPDELRGIYRELHSRFEPGSRAYGERMLAQRRKGDTAESKYAVDSLLSPAGRCVHFALGGLSR